MPSASDPLLGLQLQAAGENLAVWGDPNLNNVITQLAQAVAGMTSFTLNGETKVLTSTNYVTNEARSAILNITGGTGGTVTIPGRTKMYLVWNQATGPVVISAGDITATLAGSSTGFVFCDGSDCYLVQNRSFGGQRLLNVGTPVASTDAATKGYADGLAFNSVNLPGQGPGTVDQWIKSNGTVASWASIVLADIADYVADQTTRTNATKSFAVAMAVAL